VLFQRVSPGIIQPHVERWSHTGVADGNLTLEGTENIMAQHSENLLTSRQVETAGDGWHADGRNLFLRVDDGGKRRRWICRVTRNGRKRDFGCGSAETTSLKLARQKRDQILLQLKDGLDPVEEKAKKREAAATARAARHTFREAAEAVFANRSPGWKRGGSTAAAWIKSINVDMKPIARLSVAEIGVDHVKRVVEPYWSRGKLVAGRALLTRIEAALDYGIAHGWRSDANPAAWKVFKHILPSRPNGKKHHKALGWRETPALYAKLGEMEDMGAAVLRLIILTGCRSGEVRGARWEEFNWDERVWLVPGERMKRSVEFPVPITDQMMALLKPLSEAQGRQQLVFPSTTPSKPIPNATLWMTVQRATGKTATTHGFRSSLRSWMGDHGVPFDVAEACLAHAPGDSVVQAYNRTTMLERRRPVLQQWNDFLEGKASGEVVAIGSRRKGA
jgi:integrase